MAELKLSEFFLSAGLLEKDQWEELKKESLTSGLGVGELLFEHELISETIMEIALDLMAEVHEDKISADLAVRQLSMFRCLEAYRLSCKKRSKSFAVSRHVGQILVNAGFIDKKELGIAIINAEDLQMRLGQTLILSHLVPLEHVAEALCQQRRAKEQNGQVCLQNHKDAAAADYACTGECLQQTA